MLADLVAPPSGGAARIRIDYDLMVSYALPYFSIMAGAVVPKAKRGVIHNRTDEDFGQFNKVREPRNAACAPRYNCPASSPKICAGRERGWCWRGVRSNRRGGFLGF